MAAEIVPEYERKFLVNLAQVPFEAIVGVKEIRQAYLLSSEPDMRVRISTALNACVKVES